MPKTVESSEDQATQSQQLLAVLQNQRDTAACATSIAKLQAALREQEATLQAARESLPDLADLEKRSEAMLAAVTLGEATKAEQQQLAEQIHQRRAERADARPAIEALEKTIAGLTRRLEVALAEQEKWTADRPRLMAALLLAQAEAVGEQYVATAHELASQYAQLVGLGQLMQGFGSTSHVSSQGGDLFIPGFSLESVRPYQFAPHMPEIASSRQATPASRLGRLNNVKAGLRALGVEIE